MSTGIVFGIITGLCCGVAQLLKWYAAMQEENEQLKSNQSTGYTITDPDGVQIRVPRRHPEE